MRFNKEIIMIFQIGLYFAWLGFYNQLLIFPAIFGVLVFLYGAVTVNNWNVNFAGFVWRIISHSLLS